MKSFMMLLLPEPRFPTGISWSDKIYD
jgi:hypothetical protein